MVVYVVTENDTVYAIDADSGAVLEHRNLGTPVPRPLNCENNGNGGALVLPDQPGPTPHLVVAADVSRVVPSASSDTGAVGRALAVSGTMGADNVFVASGLWRIKLHNPWGPDRER